MSVDLPEPEGPMTAVKRPAGKPTVTPSSARLASTARDSSGLAGAAAERCGGVETIGCGALPQGVPLGRR